MPKRTNTFQQLVHKIHATCAGPDTVVTESFLEPDPDGVHREVDILVEETFDGTLMRTAIECRNHGRKASIEWLDQVVGKYDELKIDRVVLVNKAGYSTPAQAKAARNSIQLWTLTELDDQDWPDGLPFLWLVPYRERFEIDISTRGLEGSIPIPPGATMTLLFDGLPQLQDAVNTECGRRRELEAERIFQLRNTLEKLRTGSVTMSFSMSPRAPLRLGFAFVAPFTKEDIKWVAITKVDVFCRIFAEVQIAEHKRYFYSEVGVAAREPFKVVTDIKINGKPLGTIIAAKDRAD